MQDIEALTKRIVLIGKGKILLDSNLQELRNRISTLKTLTVDFSGDIPLINPDWTIIDMREGRLSISFDSVDYSVSDVITYISQNSIIQDVSVSGITSEEMVAGLYTEYKI